jgi:hypothetical protein
VTSDLLRRINYMERLLVHYAGDIKLDSESLRVMVETAEDDMPQSRQAESRDDYAASHASDYLGAELENCTVKPLENNITRELLFRMDICGQREVANLKPQTTRVNSHTGTFP